MMNLTTIETTTPGAKYTLFESTGVLTVHLAGPGATGGTGSILCGFDRFQRDENGRWIIGFSVGGGTTGPNVHHRICKQCAELAKGYSIRGAHHALFQHALRPLRDRHGDVWTLGDDGLMHSRETAPFSREHVERKWGPLLAVQEPADPSPSAAESVPDQPGSTGTGNQQDRTQEEK